MLKCESGGLVLGIYSSRLSEAHNASYTSSLPPADVPPKAGGAPPKNLEPRAQIDE